MAFQEWPYSNLYNLNLDWMLEQLKAFQEKLATFPEDLVDAYTKNNPPPYPVTSVNGETGDITLYKDQYVKLPDVTPTGTVNQNWNLYRKVSDIIRGIQFEASGKAYIMDGSTRDQIYTEANPPTYPVTSVNGKTGAVTVNEGVTSINGEAGDITGVYTTKNTPPYPVKSVNGRTGAVTITENDVNKLGIRTIAQGESTGTITEQFTQTEINTMYADGIRLVLCSSSDDVKNDLLYLLDLAEGETNVDAIEVSTGGSIAAGVVTSVNEEHGDVTVPVTLIRDYTVSTTGETHTFTDAQITSSTQPINFTCNPDYACTHSMTVTTSDGSVTVDGAVYTNCTFTITYIN